MGWYRELDTEQPEILMKMQHRVCIRVHFGGKIKEVEEMWWIRTLHAMSMNATSVALGFEEREQRLRPTAQIKGRKRKGIREKKVRENKRG